MIKAIGALEELQRIDLEIGAVEEEEKNYQKDIERLTEELEAVEEVLSGLTPDMETLDKRIAEYRDLIRQNEEKVKKDEQRLNDVKNEKELNALNKGIRAANKARKQYEEELGNVTSRADELRARVDEKKGLAEEKKAEIDRLTGDAEAKKPQWKAALEEKNQRRQALKSTIRPDVLRKYETIKARRGGRGLVPVKNETCQGCFIGIPPQVYIELKKGTEDIIICPHCHRILYFEHEDPEQSPE